jgi:uncharacterized membrane protein YjfL (UPF0719 family)
VQAPAVALRGGLSGIPVSGLRHFGTMHWGDAMADDPIFVAFDIAAVIALGWWVYKLFKPTHHVYRQHRWRIAILASLAVSAVVILFVLRQWASFDVVDAPYYIVGYMALGIVWITAAAGLLARFTDIRFQQDVRERNNFAAAVAIGGMLIGNAIAYAGGNIGDGPGFQVVIFSALLSTFTVYAAVWLMAVASDGEERITIDHDPGAALRLAAVAVGVGIIAGRAAAGDWVSVAATLEDYVAVAWPAILFVAAAIIHERATPPAYAGEGFLRSAIFAVLFIGTATAYVTAYGSW